MSSDTYTILHLTPWVRIGLITLSAALAVFTLCAARWAHRRIGQRSWWATWPLHAGIAVIVFWLFVWLSPQVYYAFYVAVLPDLGWHSVIGYPPSVQDVLEMCVIDFSADLPPIARGLLAWALVTQALWHAVVQMQRAGP